MATKELYDVHINGQLIVPNCSTLDQALVEAKKHSKGHHPSESVDVTVHGTVHKSIVGDLKKEYSHGTQEEKTEEETVLKNEEET